MADKVKSLAKDVFTQVKYRVKSFEEMKFKLLLINGPNLNMLGRRPAEHYGSFTLADLEDACRQKALSRGYDLETFQSNHEGEIIDKIQAAMDTVDGLVINPGAFTHYSHAIADALEILSLPTVEVHISDIYSREDFRKISVTKKHCLTQISGLGLEGYLQAIDLICDTISKDLDRTALRE